MRHVFTIAALLLTLPAWGVEIDALATDQPVGWNSSTQLLPNGDGGLIVEQADGTDVLTLTTTTLTTPSTLNVGGGGIKDYGAGQLGIGGGSANEMYVSAAGTSRFGNDYFGFGSAFGAGVDTTLYRDAANSLALRNSTNAQSFSVYNTYTDASNYERLRLYWNSNTAYIASSAAGTGTTRALRIESDGGITMVNQSNSVLFGAGFTQFGKYLRPSADATHDLGVSGVAWRDLWLSRYLYQQDTNADPADPASGSHVVWQSDGTGSGDDGDIMMKITDSGGTTKTITLVDFSAAP